MLSTRRARKTKQLCVWIFLPEEWWGWRSKTGFSTVYVSKVIMLTDFEGENYHSECLSYLKFSALTNRNIRCDHGWFRSRGASEYWYTRLQDAMSSSAWEILIWMWHFVQKRKWCTYRGELKWERCHSLIWWTSFPTITVLLGRGIREGDGDIG